MKKTLLLAAFAAFGLTVRAQYLIVNSLPVPDVKPATNVTPYGFNANWTPVDANSDGNPLGYYVRTYVSKTAKEDGEKFYYLDTDFSFLTSTGTEEAPLTDVSSNNMFVQAALGAPMRDCWTVLNPGYVNGELCLNGAFNYVACNGQMALAISDLSVGGGVVHIKFRIKGDGKTKKFRVFMRDTDNPNINANIIVSKNIDITDKWQDVEFTFEGGVKNADLLFLGDEMGNQTGMYYFIDDMQVWQELKKGETARALYKDEFIKNDVDASQLYVSTEDLGENEDYIYTVSTYNTEGISAESNWVTLGKDGTSPRIVDTGIRSVSTTADATSGNKEYYTTDGRLVGQGVNAGSSLPRGLYIVKEGGKTHKALVK